MPAAGLLKSVYLQYLSKPAGERQLYSLIRRHKLTKIVELGVGRGQRAVRMIELAQRYQDSEIHYAGIDMFEARGDASTGLSLKEAYKRLRATGAKVQLVPGDPFSSLARTANALSGTQLLIIAADQDEQALARAWMYIPRMLADNAHVLIERSGADPAKSRYERLSRADVESLAGAKRQRAA